MTRFKSYLLAIVGFAVAAMVGTAFGTGSAQAVVSTLVTAVNTSANPVQTQHVAADNPATQAVVLIASCSFNNSIANVTFNDHTTNMAYTVPAGMRLVIESESGSGNAPPSEVPILTLVPSFGPNKGYEITPTLVLRGPIPSGNNRYSFDSQFKAYADPGTSILAFCGDESGTGMGGFAAIAVGHLEAIQ